MDADMRILERAAAMGDEVAAERLALQRARLLPSDRWFMRCSECLSVVALDIPRQQDGRGMTRPPREASCVCGGKFYPMGRVRQEKLVDDRERCPCDFRCTDASGPKCNCGCGGKNHGKGLVVVLNAVVGGIPSITPVDAAKAKTQSEDFKAARKEAEDRVNALPGAALRDRHGRGEYLSHDEYRAFCSWQVVRNEVGRAARVQVHALRMKKLVAIAPSAAPPKIETPAPAYDAAPCDW